MDGKAPTCGSLCGKGLTPFPSTGTIWGPFQEKFDFWSQVEKIEFKCILHNQGENFSRENGIFLCSHLMVYVTSRFISPKEV